MQKVGKLSDTFRIHNYAPELPRTGPVDTDSSPSRGIDGDVVGGSDFGFEDGSLGGSPAFQFVLVRSVRIVASAFACLWVSHSSADS